MGAELMADTSNIDRSHLPLLPGTVPMSAVENPRPRKPFGPGQTT